MYRHAFRISWYTVYIQQLMVTHLIKVLVPYRVCLQQLIVTDLMNKFSDNRYYESPSLGLVLSQLSPYVIVVLSILPDIHVVTNSLFSTPLTLRLTQSPIQWVPEVKRLGREADHSPPPGAEVKNVTTPLRLHSVVLS